MKAPFALLTLFAGLAFNVQADDGLWYPPERVETRSLTREEVRAELARAVAAGDRTEGEITRFPDTGNGSRSPLTREAVQAELARERAAGRQASGELGYPPVQP